MCIYLFRVSKNNVKLYTNIEENTFNNLEFVCTDPLIINGCVYTYPSRILLTSALKAMVKEH